MTVSFNILLILVYLISTASFHIKPVRNNKIYYSLEKYNQFSYSNTEQIELKTTSGFRLYGRASKVDEKETTSKPEDEGGDKPMSLPFNGLVGTDDGNLFEKPIEVYDPTKELMDVPGEDGSTEQIEAMKKKIQDRVESLKQSGQWGDDGNNEFGKDPLSNTPIYQTMLSQIKGAQYFNSFDEFALTYGLVFFGGAVISIYLYLVQTGLDELIQWFETTDFDSDFITNLMTK